MYMFKVRGGLCALFGDFLVVCYCRDKELAALTVIVFYCTIKSHGLTGIYTFTIIIINGLKQQGNTLFTDTY